MLFNSFYFLFLFLPLTFVLWLIIKSTQSIRAGLLWLSAASLFFYAVWDVRYLFVLLTSICINFVLGGRILTANQQQRPQLARTWMFIGVCFNLCVLGGFKYSYFIIANVFSLFEQAPPIDPIVLPLAISFVTFQKIAYLVDCQRGQVKQHHPIDYLFFVSFFPQLIAGPIVHHKPLIAQTVGINPLLGNTKTAFTETIANSSANSPANSSPNSPATNKSFINTTAFIVGLSFLGIGLFKKVIFADSFARYATPIFDAAQHTIPSLASSWQAMLAYTLQLYFDFSGYSDMAIGLALLFGFKLPINFLSPYKATSIIDFWRRWHMTLSRFLRDYLYIPLGGSRHGEAKHLRNLWITMFLGGLWHGAGWTFVLWGIFHGCLLILNHLLRGVVETRSYLQWTNHPAWTPFKILITFLLIALAWVLFRSHDVTSAMHLYSGLLNANGGLQFPTPNWHSAGEMIEGFVSASATMAWVWIGLGLLIVMRLPASSELLRYDPEPNTPLRFKPLMWHGMVIGIAFWLVFKWMAVRPATEFLYFNF